MAANRADLSADLPNSVNGRPGRSEPHRSTPSENSDPRRVRVICGRRLVGGDMLVPTLIQTLWSRHGRSVQYGVTRRCVHRLGRSEHGGVVRSRNLGVLATTSFTLSIGMVTEPLPQSVKLALM